MPLQPTSPNKEDAWLQASDWDDPLDIAVFYKDVTMKNGCGHTMHWDPQKLVDCKKCPVCQGPVSFICDGSSNENPTCVSFKYGKQVYRLSVAKKATPSSQSNLLKSWIVSWMSPPGSQNNSVIVTAQDRIQQALGLVGLKVLHKGKVLCPSSSSPQQISTQLLELSDADWEHEHPKASLVVMGTLQGQELTGPPTKDAVPWTWKQILFLPLNIVHWTVHCSWLFFRTFLNPFLPMSLTSGDDEDHTHED